MDKKTDERVKNTAHIAKKLYILQKSQKSLKKVLTKKKKGGILIKSLR